MEKLKLLNEISKAELAAKDIQTLAKGSKEYQKFESLINGLNIFDKNNVPIKSVDDLVNGLKTKTISPNNLNSITTSLLKSTKDPALINKLATQIRSNKNAMDEIYRTAGQKGITPHKELLSRGYSKEQITSILGRETKTLKNVGKKVGNNTIKIGDVGANATIIVNQTQSGAVKQLISNSKEVKEYSKIAEENANAIQKMPKDVFEKLKNLGGKLSKKWLLKLGLISAGSVAVVGGGAYLMWKFWMGGTTNPESPDAKPLSDCFNGILSRNNVTSSATSNGNPVAVMKNTGNPEYDSKGGLFFFNNGRVMLGNKSMGTYNCTGGNTVVQESLNEQSNSNEIGAAEIQSAAQKLKDQLNGDFFQGDSGDMKDTLNILKTVQGKTYKGQNAIDFIKTSYKQHTGSDLVGDVTTKLTNLTWEGKEYQKESLNILNNQTTTTRKPTTGGVNGIEGINIVWDKPKNATSPTAPSTPEKPSKIKYSVCNDFPFKYGCKNEKIKDIQIKIGFPEKFQTGNFGPITKKKLSDLGHPITTTDGSTIITKDLYNKIMGTTTTSNVTEPTNISPITTNVEPGVNVSDNTDYVNKKRDYIYNKHRDAFDDFVREYQDTNPTATNDEIENAFIKTYQQDFDNQIPNPPVQSNVTNGIRNLEENINEIKSLMKKVI